jgi:hypothetical protein
VSNSFECDSTGSARQGGKRILTNNLDYPAQTLRAARREETKRAMMRRSDEVLRRSKEVKWCSDEQCDKGGMMSAVRVSPCFYIIVVINREPYNFLVTVCRGGARYGRGQGASFGFCSPLT